MHANVIMKMKIEKATPLHASLVPFIETPNYFYCGSYGYQDDDGPCVCVSAYAIILTIQHNNKILITLYSVCENS